MCGRKAGRKWPGLSGAFHGSQQPRQRALGRAVGLTSGLSVLQPEPLDLWGLRRNSPEVMSFLAAGFESSIYCE